MGSRTGQGCGGQDDQVNWLIWPDVPDSGYNTRAQGSEQHMPGAFYPTSTA